MLRTTWTRVRDAWQRLPPLVRAPLVAWIVLNVGTTLGVLPLLGNLHLFRRVPWALPATIAVMAPFWWYFTGHGPPASTRELRRHVTREKRLSPAMWRTLPLLIVLATIAAVSLRLLMPSVMPVDAPKLSIDLAGIPPATLVGLLLSLALSAGIAEEVAFRGYMQKPLEETYGLWPALLLTGLAFWFAHAEKVSWSHLPFHLFASIVLGLTAYVTRSLLPAIIGHALVDALMLAVYVFRKPDFAWAMLTARPLWAVSSAVALPAAIAAVVFVVSATLFAIAARRAMVYPVTFASSSPHRA